MDDLLLAEWDKAKYCYDLAGVPESGIGDGDFASGVCKTGQSESPCDIQLKSAKRIKPDSGLQFTGYTDPVDQVIIDSNRITG